MKQVTQRVLVGVAIFVMGAGLGLAGGTFLGHRAGASVAATLAINTQVHHAMAAVALLRALRAGDAADALEKAEHDLDETVVTLHPERYEGLRIRQSTREFIKNGLDEVRTYRDQHPRTGRDGLLEHDVARVLAIPVTQ